MERNSNFANRLKTIMEEMDLNYEQLGKKLDMNPQTLNRYVLGQRVPKIDVASEIAIKLDINPLWLQGYNVEKTKKDNAEQMPKNAIPLGEINLIPILGVIRAGVPILAEENIEGYEYTSVKKPQEHFYLRVVGDSMINANIFDGSLVLIQKQNTAENGQIVACIVDGENATLKRIKCQGDTIILMPENSRYNPVILSKKDFEDGYARIIGIAKRVLTNIQ